MKQALSFLSTFVIAGVIVFSGCTNPWEAVDQLQAEVMEVHDSSMVKMDVIYQTQKGLKQLITVEPGDSLLLDKTAKESINRALADLDEADAAMFDWMAQYKAPNKEDYTPETATTYLNEQRGSIVAVDQQMDAAIEQGKALVNQYGKE